MPLGTWQIAIKCWQKMAICQLDEIDTLFGSFFGILRVLAEPQQADCAIDSGLTGPSGLVQLPSQPHMCVSDFPDQFLGIRSLGIEALRLRRKSEFRP